MVRVNLPPMLRGLYGRTDPVEVAAAATIGELVEALEGAIPGIRARLCETDGRLRPYLVLAAGDRLLGRAPGESLPAAAPGADLEVTFLAAVAGG